MLLVRVRESGCRGALLILVGFLLAASGCTAPPDEAGEEAVPAAVTQRAALIQENYVGSDACAGCHAEQFESWRESRHHAIFKPGAEPAFTVFAPPGYRSDDLHVMPTTTGPSTDSGPQEAPRAAMRIERGGATGTFPVDAVIGGGRVESYATRLQDGAWLLLPLSYHVEQRSFIPFTERVCGFEAREPSRPQLWQAYDRVWNHRCIDCHVTAGSIGFDTGRQTYHTTFIDPGAGCEACHGPGEAHIRAAEAGGGGEGILDPAGLQPPAAVGICASCHGLAYPFESRWGGNRPYRPGDDYDQAFVPLLRPHERAPFDQITHADHTPAVGVMEYQGLVQSRCYLEGGATCTTCHLPHGGGPGSHDLKFPSASAELCAGCHEEIAARGEVHTRHPTDQPGGACIDCHMPPTVEALGTRLASHAIDIPVPANNVDFGVPDACSLCHGERGAEWAAGEVERLWGSPESRRRRRLARAFGEADEDALRGILRDAGEADLLRADAAAALARIAGRGAVLDLIEVLDTDTSLLVRRYAVDLLGGMGAPPDEGLQERMAHLGWLEEAGVYEALRRASESAEPPLRLGGAAALARLGTADGMSRLKALRAEPALDNGYRLHEALGRYHMGDGNLDEAEVAWKDVLERSPHHLTAILDLGWIYFTTERFHEARDLWMRGLIIHPDHEELRFRIHLAEDQIRGEELDAADGDT
jgi:predicted CXXCH cytochrome family protein